MALHFQPINTKYLDYCENYFLCSAIFTLKAKINIVFLIFVVYKFIIIKFIDFFKNLIEFELN